MSKNKNVGFFSWIKNIKNKILKKDIRNKNNNKKNLSLKIKKKSNNKFLTFLKKKLIQTKNKFSKIFKNTFFKQKINKKFLKKLKKKMILADIGLDTTKYILKKIKKKINFEESKNAIKIKDLILLEMKKILKKTKFKKIKRLNKPYIILIVGINGVGKTTLISKISNLYVKKNKSVILVAADTFRAAAVEQLQIWGNRIDVPVISGKKNSDPASVVYNALNIAIKKKVDYLIIDTAGRMQTKINLIRELNKIVSVIKKVNKNPPDEIMLVIDACIGQNTFNQAEIFHKSLNVNSLSLTKLDGTAKGGIIFSISRKFLIPIKYITLGESINDIQKFNYKKFIHAIFNKN
ncbi:signal recognition particle-docking protein FtsY [Buchnera aphidicola]|uniref:signal recognition particle-docking protein FtsY n=1 Tax=Buchnera aphidicola TaxID=9 RepID=UPI0034638549